MFSAYLFVFFTIPVIQPMQFSSTFEYSLHSTLATKTSHSSVPQWTGHYTAQWPPAGRVYCSPPGGAHYNWCNLIVFVCNTVEQFMQLQINLITLRLLPTSPPLLQCLFCFVCKLMSVFAQNKTFSKCRLFFAHTTFPNLKSLYVVSLIFKGKAYILMSALTAVSY